ncbi:penicillin-binding protein 2 [Elongatibacter sediminis]|uniref:Peptidoglycan D,D-transpeptidase MrdA n=1 Tax=Elongatibacter sediminis TaxID=3119006 RepID=A0AAW9R5M3_9GAMM
MNVARLLGGPHRHPIKDPAQEVRLFSRRVLVGFGFVVAAVLLLLIRYVWLQVVRHEEFTTRSISNRVRLVPVAPNRGLIYDRRGRPVAENRPAYRLEVVPEKAGELDAVLAALADIVDLPDDVREQFERDRRRYRDFEAVPLKFNLSETEVARLAVDRHRFPGVDIVPYISRYYPYGPLLTHVLGYVGRLDENDLARVNADDYRASTHIGKNGIERQYESLLHGRSGLERVETNAEGRPIRTLERTDPVHGADLVLSLDMQVQRAAWEALGDRPGAVVAMDPNDGSVLALVSKPAYDPNEFVHGISAAGYRAILEAPGRALFNRAIQGGYEPGSTLKPFVGLAGLELGVVTPEQTIFSGGRFYLPGVARPYRDWRPGGHGWVAVRDALEQSVNTYFYQLAVDLGIDRMHDYLQQFGFGSPTQIDMPGESAGVLPSRAWKRGRFSQPWYPGETVIAGIGQGFNVVTPVQLASALTTLINGGIRYQPRLLYAAKGERDQPAARVGAPVAGRVPVADPENWRAVHDGMRRVIHGVKGTARALLPIEGYEMAGKSGTAQVVGLNPNEEYDEEEVAAHLRHHALFIAYAPADRPVIAVAAVVEHGGGGSRNAAPVAKAVIEAWMAQEPGR